MNAFQCCGFAMKLPPILLPAFPEVNQFIYDSGMRPLLGWYLAKIVSISEKGEAGLMCGRGYLVGM